MTKAIGLFSGGLDSVLATRLVMDQGIEVLALCFVTPFFGAAKARAAAKLLGVTMEELDFTAEHLRMVKNPASGYGRNMNPCIDCHAMMLRYAGDLMTERGYDFLFTGEVLGERPMSQNRNALKRVAKLSGYRDHIVRPLSALCLEETAVERAGLISRTKLAGISGRSRKPQMAMAAELGIDRYEAPAGGCLLTDPHYSKRLKVLFERIPSSQGHECRLIRMGRLFWVGPAAMAIVGRRHAENERLEAAAASGDAILHVAGMVPGASVLLVGSYGDDELARAAGLAIRYSDAPRDGLVAVTVRVDREEQELMAARPTDDDIEAWRSPL